MFLRHFNTKKYESQPIDATHKQIGIFTGKEMRISRANTAAIEVGARETM